MEKPLVSVIVILNDFFHLASLTLRNIFNQFETNYEVIVVENTDTRRDLVMLKPYLEKIKLIDCSKDQKNVAFLMNLGLKKAKGKYVHFLFSGDVYLSNHTMNYIKDIIEKEKDPDLILFSFLQKKDFNPPEAVEYSKNCFQKNSFPMKISSAIIHKEAIDKLKGFNDKYKLQGGFDLLCSLLIKKDAKIFFSKRVLIDYEDKQRSSKVKINMFWENIKIFRSHFGFFKTFFWAFFYYNIKLIKMFFMSLKKAFWPA